MGSQYNVGSVNTGGGLAIIGTGNSVTVVQAPAGLLAAFDQITPILVDETPLYQHLWEPLAVPEWPHFAADSDRAEDVPRKLYAALRQRVTNLPDDRRNYLQLLVAPLGWGKTTLLMRLAADLCRQPDTAVIWLRATADDAVDRLKPLIADTASGLGRGRRLYVCMDDLLTVPKVAAFLRELRTVAGNCAQVVVIGAAQPEQLSDPALDSGGDIHAALAPLVKDSEPDLVLATFDDGELGSLYNLLDRHSQLCDRVDINPPPAPLELTAVIGKQLTPPLTDEATLRQPRQAINLLTRGELLKQVVEQKLTALQGSGDFSKVSERAPLVAVYDFVTLLGRLGVATPPQWLAELSKGNPTLQKVILTIYAEGDKDVVQVMRLNTADNSLSPMHPLDAQAAYELLHQDDGSKLKAYAGMFATVPLGAQDSALRMLHGLVNDPVAAQQGANLARGLLDGNPTKVQQLQAAANCHQLGTAWASLYNRLGQFPAAVSVASEAIKRGGAVADLCSAYRQRGQAFHSLGDAMRSAADYARATALCPPAAPLEQANKPPTAQSPALPMLAGVGAVVGGVLVILLVTGVFSGGRKAEQFLGYWLNVGGATTALPSLDIQSANQRITVAGAYGRGQATFDGGNLHATLRVPTASTPVALAYSGLPAPAAQVTSHDLTLSLNSTATELQVVDASMGGAIDRFRKGSPPVLRPSVSPTADQPPAITPPMLTTRVTVINLPATASHTVLPRATASATSTAAASGTATLTSSPTAAASRSATLTSSPTATASKTITPSAGGITGTKQTASPTVTRQFRTFPTRTATPFRPPPNNTVRRATATATRQLPATPGGTASASGLVTATATALLLDVATAGLVLTPTVTPVLEQSSTPTDTPSSTLTDTPPSTLTSTPTDTLTPLPPSNSPPRTRVTRPPLPTARPSSTATALPTSSRTPSRTATTTFTPTSTATASPTSTPTATPLPIPNRISPTDGEVLNQDNTAFSWNVIPASVVVYNIRVQRFSGGVWNDLFTASTTSSSFVGSTPSGSSYRWLIWATQGTNRSPDSSWWNFSVIP